MHESLQAVILAGGKGTRLGKLGNKIPKAMVNINGEPFLSILISQIKKSGIKKFLILTGYKKKIIENNFQNKKDIKIHKGKTNWKILTRLFKAKKLIKQKIKKTYQIICISYPKNSIYMELIIKKNFYVLKTNTY